MYKRDIATKYEVDALEKMRDLPTLNYDLPVLGFTRNQVNHDLQRWRERRIDYLKSRLCVAAYSMRRKFDRER